jgi:hypothetical protein
MLLLWKMLDRQIAKAVREQKIKKTILGWYATTFQQNCERADEDKEKAEKSLESIGGR